MTDTDKLVLIVHSIDTEGPLHESLSATFGRLAHLHGITVLPETRETLEKLKAKRIDLGNKTDVVAEVVSGHLLTYNDTWDKIDDMLDRITGEPFRNAMTDSFGGGWIYNWHCLDHVGFQYNPRRRDMGYHQIFDHYASRLSQQPGSPDSLQFHFHPMSTYREAHRCATSFVNSPELYEILCRRVIERRWFPSVFRAGFQTERPDSNLFLEQWIPFDISNMAVDDPSEFDKSIDFKNGRSGDWRLAPADWSIYHPHHDYYQKPGNCRRWIARCLNVLNRIAPINEHEMDKAFARADGGTATLVGVTGHDFRNLGTEVDHIRGLVAASSDKFPEVQFKFCRADDAFRHVTGSDDVTPVELSLELERTPKDDVPNLTVKTKAGKVFGPQPFLAIETMSRRFIHDNFDFSTSGDTWHFAFHTDTLPLSDVRRIGVATNDEAGHTWIDVIDVNI
jgi:hypothetical protein